ncbi:MAG: HlyC/CorC family transporter [Chloroflexia bacterium]|nr:HlyC/CorC family transporter [Chloroflexia bacterium]
MLVLLNGFFVATEFALVSVRRTRVQQLATEGNRRAHNVLDRLNHLDTYIAATQLGITIASLALGWIGEPAIGTLIEPVVHALPFAVGETLSHTISIVIAFSIVTTLHIVIGELAPKSLALQRPEATALFVSGPVHLFLVIFRPVIFGLNWIGNAVVKLFGIEPAAGHTLVQSAEELMLSIDASREAGLVDAAAHDLVDRAFTFTDLQARHVMVPRTELTAVPIDATMDDIITLASTSSYTRLPVFEGDNDHIVGILKIKRLLPLFLSRAEQSASGSNGQHNGESPAPFDIRDYMMIPTLVPETLAAAEVLTRMRESHVQMAVVIDEYGGTAGIVTLQDIVTHLIGRIREEEETSAPEGLRPDGSLALDGLTGLVELRERYNIDLESEEIDVETLGGFVFFALGRPAKIGDEVNAPSGQLLRVEELDGLRVARVRVLPGHGRDPATVGNEARNAAA